MFKPLKTNFMKKLLLVFVSALTLLGCKKVEGPAGKDGKDGVSNIKTTQFSVNTNQWIYDNQTKEYFFNINVPAININVINIGAVSCFMSDAAGEEWIAMPFTYNGVQSFFSFKESNVTVSFSLSSGGVPGNPGFVKYKVVVIPPAMVKPNVNFNNYSELKKAYNID